LISCHFFDLRLKFICTGNPVVYPARLSVPIYYKGRWHAQYTPVICKFGLSNSIDLDYLQRVPLVFLEAG